MSSKKKMIIAISAFALVVVATVVSVVAVLAAANVTIQNSLNISYTVSDVVADVAVYAKKVETNASLTAATSLGTAKTADFDVNYTGTGETVAFDEIEITKNECVVLKFVFNNNSAKAFTATLTAPTTTNKNVNIYYSTDITTLLSSTTTTATPVNVASGEDKSGTYYAVIKIADTTKNVDDFAANFSWALA